MSAPSFQFVYVSTVSGLHNEAAELFSFLVEGKGLSDLIRYFDYQTKWDRKQYRLLTENDVLFLSEASKRFSGPSIATLYYLWKRNRLPKDLQPEAAPAPTRTQKILFRAVTVRGHETIFGDSHLLTVHEVAKLLHVPASWVYERTRKRSLDRLPGYRLGKYWRFREEEIHAWVKRQG